MYDLAYNFDADPFRLSPDHRFCFRHKSYSRSKAYLDYALKRGEGFVMITGSPGSGKTTLLNDVLTNADTTNRAMARIVTTQLDANNLLRMVAFSFKLDTQRIDKASILYHLEEFLVRQHKQHRHSLLVIDEAQDLDKTALEEIRLLTNLQIDGNSLLQVFLVGQNNLLDMIQDPTMEQLHQRMIASSHLEPMAVEETETYVIHRLRTAGWRSDPLISRGALRRIHIFSRGIPRIVNQLCSRFLLYGSVEDKHKLDSHDTDIVIKELCHEHLAPITDNLSSENLFSNKQFTEEEDSIERYDHVFLDSTAFGHKHISKPPRKEHQNNPKIQHISHARPVPSKPAPSIKSETTARKVENNEIAKPKTQEAPISPADTNDVQVTNTADQRQIRTRRPVHRPYAASGFLLLLLVGMIILVYPEPSGKQAAPLNVLDNSKNKDKEVSLVSDQNNIETNLSRQAIQYTQSKKGTFNLQLDVEDQFSWGSAIMSHTLQSKLASLASIMRDQPQSIIHIIGHCDPTGSQARNNVLSKLRAKVVANYLVLQGIPQHRLTTEGRGSSQQVKETNPQANRRVELVIETLNPGNTTRAQRPRSF